MADNMTYRLALILPHSRQVVAVQVDEALLLPQINIPLWERPAEQLTRLIEERWRMKSIVLDIVFDHRPESPCAIIEIASPWPPSPEGLTAVDSEKISDQSLLSNERKVLQLVLTGADPGRGHSRMSDGSTTYRPGLTASSKTVMQLSQARHFTSTLEADSV